MRGKGITHDSGLVHNGVGPTERPDPAVVRRELSIIRDQLHCNAVRLIGGDPERLDLASLGIVRMLEGGHGRAYPDLAWEPKAAFGALAEYYGSH